MDALISTYNFQFKLWSHLQWCTRKYQRIPSLSSLCNSWTLNFDSAEMWGNHALWWMDRKLTGDVNWFAEFQSTCSLSGRHAMVTQQQPVRHKSYKRSGANLQSPDIYSENIQRKFFSQAVLLNNVIVKSFPTLYSANVAAWLRLLVVHV